MRKSPALFTIALTLAAIILVPRDGARAQDPREGPTEINQCQTISQPGSYKLVDNLTFSGPNNGTCLSITASYVTIDLAGFTISNSNGFGLSNVTMAIAAGNDTESITVRNGSISGFGSGVDLGGSNSIVEGLHVGGPCPCVGVGISATGIVKGNSVVGIAGGPGEGVGISATGIVTGNYVSNSRVANFQIGQGSTVIGNTATQSGDPGFGIEVSCPSNVTDNTAVNNRTANLILNGTGCNNTNNVAP